MIKPKRAKIFHRRPRRAVIVGNLLEPRIGRVPYTGAELGVFWGETLLYLHTRFPGFCLIGVDAWEYPAYGPGSDDGFRSYRKFPLERFYDDVMVWADKTPMVQIVRDDTAAAALQFPDDYVDFIFIDADHTEAGVRADIYAWAPKVRSDGIIIGHDHEYPSVKRAIDDLLPGWTAHEHSVWSIDKRDTCFP